MTFEEARKILDEENCFCIINVVKPLEVIELLPWEKTEVNEAIATMGEYGYRASYVRMADTENRLKKLKAKYDKAHPAKKNDTRKDYEKVSQIVDKLIEEEGEPINGEHLNPALRDAAKEFNDALLDEQAKMIKGLEEKNKKLNDIIASRNNEILELQEKVKKMAKMGKTIAHLNEVIGKKNAQLKDYKIACEEHDEQLKDYMLSDKNKDDMISGLKKLNEGLRHKLAEATVNKVNEQALKSAENSLVYKDGVIDKQKKELWERRIQIARLRRRIRRASAALNGIKEQHDVVCVADPIADFFKFVKVYGRTE